MLSEHASFGVIKSMRKDKYKQVYIELWDLLTSAVYNDSNTIDYHRPCFV